MKEDENAIHYVCGKGGPTLLDAMVDSDEIAIIVNGPGMLFKKLRFVTSLGMFDGCYYSALVEFAANLYVSVDCGSVGRTEIEPTVATSRAGPSLEIDLGPLNMYQSEMTLRIRDGSTFRQAIRSSLATINQDVDMIAGFSVVPAVGHHEHHTMNAVEEPMAGGAEHG